MRSSRAIASAWETELGKRILFIKDKSSEIVGFICLFPQKWFQELPWQGGNWVVLGLSLGHPSLTLNVLKLENDPKCCGVWPWPASRHPLLAWRTCFPQQRRLPALLLSSNALIGVLRRNS